MIITIITSTSVTNILKWHYSILYCLFNLIWVIYLTILIISSASKSGKHDSNCLVRVNDLYKVWTRGCTPFDSVLLNLFWWLYFSDKGKTWISMCTHFSRKLSICHWKSSIDNWKPSFDVYIWSLTIEHQQWTFIYHQLTIGNHPSKIWSQIRIASELLPWQSYKLMF